MIFYSYVLSRGTTLDPPRIPSDIYWWLGSPSVQAGRLTKPRQMVRMAGWDAKLWYRNDQTRSSEVEFIGSNYKDNGVSSTIVLWCAIDCIDSAAFCLTFHVHKSAQIFATETEKVVGVFTLGILEISPDLTMAFPTAFFVHLKWLSTLSLSQQLD